MSSDAEREAEERYPHDDTVDMPPIVRLERISRTWGKREGWVDRAEWVLAQLPDRETIARTLYEAPFDGMDDTVWPPAHPTDREWWLTRADAVTALINGEGT